VGAGDVVVADTSINTVSGFNSGVGVTLSRGEMPDQPIAIAISASAALNDSQSSAEQEQAEPPLVAVSCKRGGAVYLLSPHYE
jgi:hypothetical protein